VQGTLALIDQILDEHNRIHQDLHSLERVSSDLDALVELDSDRTKSYFVARTPNGRGKGLQQWQDALEAIDKGLRAHFHREETLLSEAFQKHGNTELASALDTLLREHDDLRGRVAKLRKDAADLAAGGLRVEVWEANGWGMRVNIDRIRALIESHASSEQRLLNTLRSELQKA